MLGGRGFDAQATHLCTGAYGIKIGMGADAEYKRKVAKDVADGKVQEASGLVTHVETRLNKEVRANQEARCGREMCGVSPRELSFAHDLIDSPSTNTPRTTDIPVQSCTVRQFVLLL